MNGRNVQRVNYELRDLPLLAALLIPDDDKGIDILTTVRPASLSHKASFKSMYDFVVSSILLSENGDQHIENARGKICIISNTIGKATPDLRGVAARLTIAI